MRRLLLSFALIVMCISLVGCATPSGKTVGEAIDDAGIVTKVNVAIFNDPELKVFQIDASSYRGVVTLTGRVTSREQEKRAMEVAKKVDGVKDVRSTLVISAR